MRRTAGLFALILILHLGCSGGDSAESTTAVAEAIPAPPTPYVDAAWAAGRWIDSQARETEAGLSWSLPVEFGEHMPEDLDPKVVSLNHGLYKGDGGTIRFWLEAYRHSGEEAHLERARRGADEILAHLPETAPENSTYAFYYGLHDGWAGVMWLLEQVHQQTGEARFRDGALRLLEQIHDLAQDDGEGGVHWDETNELFYGNAGYGLALLWAAETFDHAASRELAIRAGRWLLGTAQPRPGGVTWSWGLEDPELVMPNFSHGTAGVSYFLARLYEVTGEQEFLDTALAGAGHLKEIAETDEGRYCLVFHYENTEERQGEDRHYLGFCHGPVGTTRLFERLYLAMGDAEWRLWVDRGARAISESGIPEQETPGFWNNVSQCCGSAGVVDYFVDRYRRTGDEADLAFARRMADNLVKRATPEADGLKWIQAEHRVRPEQLEAQVGFMQGAAGIATALLHLDAAIRGLEIEPLRFVDDPWGEIRMGMGEAGP